jgi:diguanylate cyclase (GGDEF)-like protein
MGHGSWLFPDGVDRERMLEMDRLLRPIRRLTFGVLAIALVLMGPWLGYWTLAPLALAAAVFDYADLRIARMGRPEWGLFAAYMCSQVIIGAACALTGEVGVPTLCWLTLPIITLAARFSMRGIALGVGFALGVLLVVTFGTDPRAVLDYPPLVIAPAALMIGVAMFQTSFMRSDIKQRAEAMIDPLTGLLNRKALDRRAEELAQQAAVTALPVAVVVGDVDHFKVVNDTRGHARGDEVLKAVAQQLRETLRAFDLVYRIGGEEFLVLLPGADEARAVTLAEELREAIERETEVTMSFGVAASHGADFDYGAVFAAADKALYDAKAGGRNRVESAVELVFS